jgi:hypothetical protein
MQQRGRGDQYQKKQRHDDWRDDPVGHAKLGQDRLLFAGGSVRDPQSPMEAVGRIGDGGRYACAPAIASGKAWNPLETTWRRRPGTSFSEKPMAYRSERAHAASMDEVGTGGALFAAALPAEGTQP